MKIPFEQLRELEVASVLDYLGIEQRNKKINCPNPSHFDEHPSCHVYEHSVYCFSCGYHGDAVKIYQDIKGIPTADAASELCRMYGIPMEDRPRTTTANKPTPTAAPPQISTVKKWHAAAFKHLISERERLRGLLEQNGESTDPAIVGEAVRTLTDVEHMIDMLTTPTDPELLELYNDREHYGLKEVDTEPEQAAGLDLKTADEFKPEPVQWLWRGRIPLQFITFLMSPGGCGKSFVSAVIAAAVSRGRPLPDGGTPTAPGNVLYLSAEDSGSIVKERLQSCDADLSRIYIQDIDAERPLMFPDTTEDAARMDEWNRVLDTYKPRLVICDVWHAFTSPDIDLNRQNAVRAVLRAVARLAKTHNAAFLLLAHTSKRRQETNLNDALLGSSDSVNAARSVLMIVTDSDSGEKALLHTKCNLAGLAPSLEFQIDAGELTFGGISPISKGLCEEAARKHCTPWELAKAKEQTAETNTALLSCLAELAEIGKTVFVPYEKLAEIGGEDIFRGRQPKRALDALSKRELLSRGLSIATGARRKVDGETQRGLHLSCNTTSEEIAGAIP